MFHLPCYLLLSSYGYGMSNLETTSKGDLIFKCGTVVVIMNKSKQQQRFFRKHDATVTRYTVISRYLDRWIVFDSLPIQRFYWCWILKSRDFETVHWSLAKIKGLSLTQDINRTQIRYSEGVQDVLWKSYLHLGMLSLLWNNLIAAVLISLEVEIWVLSIEYWTH